MPTEAQINWAIRTLRKRAEELGFPPRKADFDDATRARIKTFLGPWPRALEAAGLKDTKKNSTVCSTIIPSFFVWNIYYYSK